ncbi:MAG: carboxypeptidase-like regulatory domain-containing protein [Granulicella sp.]
MALWLGCLLMMGVVAKAQVVTADILGTVTDAGGAVVPNAAVTVTNLGTNEVRTANSSESGDFTIALLPVATIQ